MRVLVAEKYGFCHGVRNAIRMAEWTLSQETGKGSVYSLGPIIHNEDEVERLAKAGLKTVSRIEDIQSGTVIIRSHGAAPAEIAKLKDKGLVIVDATCVLVKRVQQLTKELEEQGYKVVIIGDATHPEVQAVVGCVHDVVVIVDESDLHKLPTNGRLGIVCQTTQSPEHLGDMLRVIGRRDFSEMKVINTLCKESVRRQQAAVQLCGQVDVMFVLGGLESANTRKLAELCRGHNNAVYHLQNWGELDVSVLRGKTVAGVTAGASTPDRIIDEFVRNLEAHIPGDADGGKTERGHS